MKETPGIVLIDELDLHLHPNWQKQIVDDLKRVFPKIQFIATTHSPFIVQSLKSDELVVLDKSYSPDGMAQITNGIRTVVLSEIHLPHTHNTFQSIIYKEGGLVEANACLPYPELNKAKRLIDLIGLDKRPGSPTFNLKNKDNRWKHRRECWELAERQLDKHIKGFVILIV